MIQRSALFIHEGPLYNKTTIQRHVAFYLTTNYIDRPTINDLRGYRSLKIAESLVIVYKSTPPQSVVVGRSPVWRALRSHRTPELFRRWINRQARV